MNLTSRHRQAVDPHCDAGPLDALLGSAHHLGQGKILERGGMVRPVGMLVVFALTLAGTRARADDMLIVPGKRVGAVTVGMSRTQVDKLLGAASSSNELSPHRANAVWPLPGKGDIHVQFVDGKAVRVGTTAKEYATSDGLAGGASVAKMRSLHPAVTETDYQIQRKGGVSAQCYDDVAAGIGFEFDKGPQAHDFVLRATYVHAPGTAIACNRKDDPRALEHVAAPNRP